MNNKNDELDDLLSASKSDGKLSQEELDELVEATKADMKAKGCPVCATEHPKVYKMCMNIKRRAEKLHKRVPSVCGGEDWGRGLNHTPPKKKKKRKKNK